jgi:hypothetical protein
MDDKQSDQFREAIEKKNEEATQREHSDAAATQSQDKEDVRDKSTGHGKKTADKWNQ